MDTLEWSSINWSGTLIIRGNRESTQTIGHLSLEANMALRPDTATFRQFVFAAYGSKSQPTSHLDRILLKV